ncbi:DUF664 domain-containing protein [Streptomyces melanogenes]|uniref:mycothiol transferase n=1 Tax=Streptomyces melanogenes TaxID=67326 RepID=UPI0037963C26
MPEGWLDFQRATLALKCAGLDHDQLRTALVEPSAMALLGLVRHRAEIERNGFQRVLAGLDIPFLFGKEGDAPFRPRGRPGER